MAFSTATVQDAENGYQIEATVGKGKDVCSAYDIQLGKAYGLKKANGVPSWMADKAMLCVRIKGDTLLPIGKGDEVQIVVPGIPDDALSQEFTAEVMEAFGAQTGFIDDRLRMVWGNDRTIPPRPEGNPPSKASIEQATTEALAAWKQQA